MENMEKIFQVLNHLLKTQTDTEALIDICKSISYLSDATDKRIQAVIDSIDLKPLLELLGRHQMTEPVLYVFANIVSGDDSQTEVVVQLGIVEHLLTLIEHPKETIKSTVCWLLLNIAAGTISQIQVSFLKSRVKSNKNIYLSIF